MAENPPRENLIRGVMPGLELREAETGAPKLFGHFARFNEWTEINSAWEGRFMERIAPGAFSKTIAENRNGMRVLFDHGHDPSIGNKPLGTISELREDEHGASYEVDLFDTEYVRELLPPLKAGALGASFRFKVMREDFNKKPERSDSNPDQLPERTIVEAKVMEFGPVTFPAYDGATAGVRSMTDEFILAHLFAEPERLQRVLEMRKDFAPSTPEPAEATQEPERRDNRENRFKSREEYLSWLTTRS
jgi:HK97 family phage prohead protease